MQATSLEVRDLKAGYGDAGVLIGVSLEVEEREILGIVGPNGAGKSTLLRCLSGLLPVREGIVLYNGMEITNVSSRQRAKMGITLCLEGGKVFPEMDIEDNLLTGGYLRDKKQRRELLLYVYELFPRLSERREQLAGTLSGGERQMVSLGRALMSKPSVLMLDEPSFGLAPLAKKTIYQGISRINQEEGISILIVEQDAMLALRFSRRGYALENGRIAMEGTSEELLKNDLFKKVYLGL